MRSQPSAAASIAGNWPLAISAARRGRSTGGLPAVAIQSRTPMKAGTKATPARFRRSMNSWSGGALTTVSTPSACSATASPAIGSTSPREP